jgi:hypothetical protein
MKTFALLSVISAASAFTGTPLQTRKAAGVSSLSMSVFEDYVGAKDFRGGEFKFDPVSSCCRKIFKNKYNDFFRLMVMAGTWNMSLCNPRFLLLFGAFFS